MNLPASPKGADENLAVALPVVHHAVSLINVPSLNVQKIEKNMHDQKYFSRSRPTDFH